MAKTAKFSLLVCLSCALFSCVDLSEGCQDTLALNFDVSANKDCPDPENCCEYPTFSMSVLHKVANGTDTTNLVIKDSIYRDDFGNDFWFSSVKLYFSDPTFTEIGGKVIIPQKRTRFYVVDAEGDTSTSTRDDQVALIDPTQFAPSSFGQFEQIGTFTEFSLTLGNSDELQDVIPFGIDSDEPLADTAMYAGPDTGYVSIQLILVPGTDTSATAARQVFEITKFDASGGGIPLQTNYVPEPRENRSLDLTLEYTAWLKGIDVTAGPTDQNIRLLIDNLSQALSVFKVE